MLHDSKFAPKIGIVQQNSSVPSVVSYFWQVPAASVFQYPTVCMIKEFVRLTLYRSHGFLLAES